MITELGKQLRIIRIEKGELLRDMASTLGITSAYLSSIENGKRKPTKEFINNLLNVYRLSEIEEERIIDGFYKTVEEIRISYEDISDEKLDLGLAFARKFNELSSDEVKKIKKILNK